MQEEEDKERRKKKEEGVGRERWRERERERETGKVSGGRLEGYLKVRPGGEREVSWARRSRQAWLRKAGA